MPKREHRRRLRQVGGARGQGSRRDESAQGRRGTSPSCPASARCWNPRAIPSPVRSRDAGAQQQENECQPFSARGENTNTPSPRTLTTLGRPDSTKASFRRSLRRLASAQARASMHDCRELRHRPERAGHLMQEELGAYVGGIAGETLGGYALIQAELAKAPMEWSAPSATRRVHDQGRQRLYAKLAPSASRCIAAQQNVVRLCREPQSASRCASSLTWRRIQNFKGLSQLCAKRPRFITMCWILSPASFSVTSLRPFTWIGSSNGPQPQSVLPRPDTACAIW